MVDIHSHILPNIDDGPSNITDSLVMLANTFASGIDTVISTPHLIDGLSEDRINECNEALVELRNITEKNDINIQLKSGFECYITPDFTKKDANLSSVTINKNGRYLLIEFPMKSIPPYADEVFANLKTKGIMPIIAHPERNYEIMEDPNILYNFILHGCLAQVNAGSIIGHYGKQIKETSKILLSHNMIHLIASDMHSVSSLTIKQAMPDLISIIGHNEALDMINDNSFYILLGREFKRKTPIPYEYQKRNIGNLFGTMRKKE
jgi:protein-tyrosine phosphatase